MKVFVTGGTGLIGGHLIKRLGERHDSVVLLTRRAETARARFAGDCQIVEADPMQRGDWMDAIADCDAVVNLAGESIFGRRWNDDFKQLLHDSRVKTTEHVVEAIHRRPQSPPGGRKALINASAIGYYGPLADEEVTEEHPAGDDTLARLCVAWEKAAQAAEPLGLRVG